MVNYDNSQFIQFFRGSSFFRNQQSTQKLQNQHNPKNNVSRENWAYFSICWIRKGNFSLQNSSVWPFLKAASPPLFEAKTRVFYYKEKSKRKISRKGTLIYLFLDKLNFTNSWVSSNNSHRLEKPRSQYWLMQPKQLFVRSLFETRKFGCKKWYTNEEQPLQGSPNQAEKNELFLVLDCVHGKAIFPKLILLM